MNAAKRSRRRQGWPVGLYEPRPGYYVYRTPAGVTHALGAIPLAHAVHQVLQVIAHYRANAPSLLDKISGRSNSLADVLEKMPASAVVNTAKNHRTYDKIIRETLGAKSCLDLTVADCAAVIEARAVDRARSAQALRSRLIAVCQRAESLGWMDGNPASTTRNPTVEIQRGRLTLETFRAIYERAPEASEWLQQAMRLAVVTGQDRQTVAGMTRSMVSTIDGERVLIVQRSKTRRTNSPLAIPLRLRLDVLGWSLDEVLAHKTGVVSPHYLHHVQPHGRAPTGSAVGLNAISRAFTRAREMAGIPDAAAPTFHELRSLSKRLYEKQGNVNTKQLLGHSTDRAAGLYADARGVEALLVRVG